MPAALGTVKIRGSVCEGKFGRNLCNVEHIYPQGNSLCYKLVGEVSLWWLPKYVHRGQNENQLKCIP